MWLLHSPEPLLLHHDIKNIYPKSGPRLWNTFIWLPSVGEIKLKIHFFFSKKTIAKLFPSCKNVRSMSTIYDECAEYFTFTKEFIQIACLYMRKRKRFSSQPPLIQKIGWGNANKKKKKKYTQRYSRWPNTMRINTYEWIC